MRVLALAAISTALLGCAAKAPDLRGHLTSLDLSPAAPTPDIEAAVLQANFILAAGDSGVRLQLGGDDTAACNDGNAVVPVAWVTAPQSSDTPMAYVPGGAQGIVLNSRSVDGFLYRYATEQQPLHIGDRPLKVGEPHDLLTLILLHEAGHVSLGHAGSFVAHRLDSRTHTNAIKQIELDADGFAAESIRAAFASGDERAIHSGKSVQALTARFSAQQAMERMSRYPPSRYVGVFAQATNPNATVFGDRRQVFGDGEATHPNLELRMLVIGYRINPVAGAAGLRSYLEYRGDKTLLRLLGLTEPQASEGGTP